MLEALPAQGGEYEFELSTSSSSMASARDASPPPPNAGGLPLDGSVVKLKGLPYKAGGDDVVRFFAHLATLSPDAVYMRRHPDGRPNGDSSGTAPSPSHSDYL